jgi:hypothetical protein
MGAAFIAQLRIMMCHGKGCTNLPGGPTFRDDEYVNTAFGKLMLISISM